MHQVAVDVEPMKSKSVLGVQHKMRVMFRVATFGSLCLVALIYHMGSSGFTGVDGVESRHLMAHVRSALLLS